MDGLPSNRKFGLFFATIALVGAVVAYWKHSHLLAACWVACSAWFGICAAWLPDLLAPLNRLWYRLGLLLGRIVSPVVLGLIFFVLLTPVAWLGRLAGRDELRLRKRSVQSYWIDRTPPGPAPASFKNQY
jgi:ABC-type sulfate transport system permease subunit